MVDDCHCRGDRARRPCLFVHEQPTAGGPDRADRRRRSPRSPPGSAGTVPPPPIPAPTSPTVVAEADLFAIDPERLLDQAAAHAEWFVAEYVGVDGSEESRATLAALLPAGIPVPAAPESTRVFVEWVRAVSVEETAPLNYRVAVLVRSLVANGEEAYRRLPPMLATVEVSVADDRSSGHAAADLEPSDPVPAPTPDPGRGSRRNPGGCHHCFGRDRGPGRCRECCRRVAGGGYCPRA